MKSSYYLILLIIGIIILHAVDDRKDRKSPKPVKESAVVKIDSLNNRADSLATLAAYL